MLATLERQIRHMGHGDHLCQVYDTADERLAAAVPFLREGLARDEYCVHIADRRTARGLLRALSAAGVDVARERERGALTILTEGDTYLRAGRFDPAAMVAFLRGTAEEAVCLGFPGFRVSGEMSWALRRECDCRRLAEYEAEVGRVLPGSRILALCQYDRRRFAPDILHHVLRTHPSVIVGAHVCPNPFYEPPEVERDCPSPEDAGRRRVDWMLDRLRGARVAEQTREELTSLLEQELEQRRRADALVRGQKEVLELMVRGAPLATVLEGLARTAEAESGDSAVAGILLLDEDGLRLRHGAAPSLPHSYNQAIDGVSIHPHLGSCAAAAARGELVIVEDIAAHPNWETIRHLPLEQGLRAAWSMPIFSSGGRVLGTFGIYYREPRGPSPHDLETIEVLSRTAGLAIERERSERERRELLRRETDARSTAEAAERRYVDLVNGLDAVVWEADPCTWEFRFVSRQAEAMLGYPVERWLRDPGFWLGMVHPEDRARCVELCRRATAACRSHDFEYRAVAADGRVVWLRDIVCVVPGADGAPCLLRGVIVDVTRVKELEERLRQRADALAETDRRKTEFLAMLAHELRSPLAPIAGAAEVLRHLASDEPAVRRQQAIIERSGRHLARLVDDLLEISRINEGMIELRRQDVELTDVVREAVAGVRASADARGQALSVTLPGEPVYLRADPTRLTQVVVNLLNNALKFTPDGGSVAVAAWREGEDACIRVRDDGCGIEPELLPRVFDLFVQAPQPLARTDGGLGIGLTLVKRLVELHGGTVQARSEGRMRGSEFVVRLPVGADPVAAPAGSAAPPAPLLASRRVLVVEDNRDAAETLAELLSIWGCRVRVAHDGCSALEAVPEFQPDVVLLDLGLPGMDGFEVARRLRSGAAPAALLVALTGYGDAHSRRRVEKAGFDHHLTKPVDAASLRALLGAGSAPGRRENAGEDRGVTGGCRP